MQAYPECIPCLIRQGLNAVQKLNLSKYELFEVVKFGTRYLAQFESYDKSPAYYAYHIQQWVKKISGSEDPFKELKSLSNKRALAILNHLMVDEILNCSEDRLKTALKISAIGNILDFAILSEEEAFNRIKELLKKDFEVDHYESFKKDLKKTKKVLILGDNAGEIVFDKILVKELINLGIEVVYVVKGGPILNDATYEDAIDVSLTSLCKVITNGNDRVGTVLKYASEEFLKEWNNTDVVISKGQANFESLSDIKDKKIYFLLTAKCNPIVKETGAKKVGDLIFKSIFKP